MTQVQTVTGSAEHNGGGIIDMDVAVDVDMEEVVVVVETDGDSGDSCSGVHQCQGWRFAKSLKRLKCNLHILRHEGATIRWYGRVVKRTVLICLSSLVGGHGFEPCMLFIAVLPPCMTNTSSTCL